MITPAIKRVGIVVKPHQQDVLKTLCQVVSWLSERGITLVSALKDESRQIERETGCAIEVLPADQVATKVDLMLVLGGDGTMIATSRLVGDSEVPVLGVNYGRLGYLAEFRIEELYPALETILQGDYAIEKRVMLTVELQRGWEQVSRNRVLNDIVINKGALARIIEIEAFINEQFVNSFRADGLIVASPTGSTAYNLSAGGPVVYPSMNAIIITPICPFTLSNRPIVVPDESQIELRLKTPNEDVLLTLDGQVGLPLKPDDRVLIRKSRATFNLVQPTNRNYFEVLREKLRWGR